MEDLDYLKPFKIRTSNGRFIVLQAKNKQYARERFEAEYKRVDISTEKIVSIEKVT